MPPKSPLFRGHLASIATVVPTTGVAPDEVYSRERIAHWNSIAREFPEGSRGGGEYHRRLLEVYKSVIAPGSRVLELGCGTGDLLAALEPSEGVGVDFSPAMLERGRARHPQLSFAEADVHDLSAVNGPFDVVILSDLVNDLYDVQRALEEARRLCDSTTRVVINIYSHLWELPLRGAARFGLATPRQEQNWLTPEDLTNLLALAGFEVVRLWQEVLLPLPIPGLRSLANRYLVKLWPLRWFALSNFVVARTAGREAEKLPLVSVIVPARNEAGNIEQIFRRVPDMGAGTEIVFVEGHSRDDTYGAIERGIAANPQRRCKLLRQTGVGKGDAVRLGFDAASGDVLDDPGRRFDGPTRRLAALRRGTCVGSRGVRERRPPRVSDARRSDAVSQPRREQVLQPGLQLAPGPDHQGHAVRHEGAVAGAITSDWPRTGRTSATSTRSATSTCSSAPQSSA